MEYADFTPLLNKGLEIPNGFPDVPILAIGWLEKPPERPDRAPNRVASRLTEAYFSSDYISDATKGHQVCVLCPTSERRRKPGVLVTFSNRRQRIEGRGYFLIVRKNIAYASPTLLPHYMQEHLYHPSMEFIEAVFNGKFYSNIDKIDKLVARSN